MIDDEKKIKIFMQRRDLTWKLDENNNAVPCSIAERGESITEVCQEKIEGYFISTVFLGINHGWGNGPPLLFETMIFDQNVEPNKCWQEIYTDRYSTFQQAEAGHIEAVEWLKNHIKDIKKD